MNKVLSVIGSVFAYGITETIANILNISVEQIIIFLMFVLVVLAYRVIFQLLKLINTSKKVETTKKL